jgi:hypothetical protein
MNQCCQTGFTCCGGTVCCPVASCCANGTCCAHPCNECLIYGDLSGGTVVASPPVGCVGDTITFTASGVSDSGGQKRVECSPFDIEPVPPTYTWVVTKPNGATVNGSGPVATVTSALPGEYSCTFTAKPNRDCLPADLQIAPATAKGVRLTSETEATTPADRTRTTFGIGERVTISVDPPRSATWSVTGGGASDPPTGTSTVFTARMSPSVPVVEAVFAGGTRCPMNFTVIAPDGLTSSLATDDGCGTLGPPNNSIGAKATFDQVVLPTDVSFYRASFRENITGGTFVWPNGTTGSYSATIWNYTVNQVNEATDSSKRCGDPIGKLDPPPPGGGLAAFRFAIRLPSEYQDDDGAWHQWLSENHPKEYDTAGKCRTLIEATNTAAGSWQGPWQ